MVIFLINNVNFAGKIKFSKYIAFLGEMCYLLINQIQQMN